MSIPKLTYEQCDKIAAAVRAEQKAATGAGDVRRRGMIHALINAGYNEAKADPMSHAWKSGYAQAKEEQQDVAKQIDKDLNNVVEYYKHTINCVSYRGYQCDCGLEVEMRSGITRLVEIAAGLRPFAASLICAEDGPAIKAVMAYDNFIKEKS